MCFYLLLPKMLASSAKPRLSQHLVLQVSRMELGTRSVRHEEATPEVYLRSLVKSDCILVYKLKPPYHQSQRKS